MTEELSLATDQQMQDLTAWRELTAKRLPEILGRVFALRAEKYTGVSTSALETRFGWHLTQVHSKKRVPEDAINLEKNSFDNLVLALTKAEWSAANNATNPDAPGAPWGPKGTPAERLKAEMNKFEAWVVDNALVNQPLVQAANLMIDEHGISTFSDLWIDGLADFKSHIVQRALHDGFWTNNELARTALIETDEWFYGLRLTIANRDVTAMMFDRGPDAFLEIMDKIAAPAAQPGI